MTEPDSSRGDIFNSLKSVTLLFLTSEVAKRQNGVSQKRMADIAVFKYVFVAFPPNSFQHRPKSSSSLAFKASSFHGSLTFQSKLFKSCGSLCNTITNCLDEKMQKILISFSDQKSFFRLFRFRNKHCFELKLEPHHKGRLGVWTAPLACNCNNLGEPFVYKNSITH